jgi:sterol desaturase/sphingolipid hydroxylase (fatty acid hydroxylase superfamily)
MKRQAIFGIMVGLFLLLLALEQKYPLRHGKRLLLTRILVNTTLSLFAFAIGASVVTPAALSLAGWASEKPFGLIHLASPLPWVVQVILGFLLMDLSFYYWHLANHKVRFLWRFHNVHHIDPDLDVSTAIRFHFGEVLFSTGFRVMQVGLIGVSPWIYFLYELAFQANTLFHHSNLRLPITVERVLNKLLVTPRMHGIHHSVVERETNSNYSVVLSCWDRLHRSIRLGIAQSEVVVGVPAYLAPEDNRLWNVLTLPFQKQRNYWRYPDGMYPVRGSKVEMQERSRMMD